jgi:prolyl oligopeptidase
MRHSSLLSAAVLLLAAGLAASGAASAPRDPLAPIGIAPPPPPPAPSAVDETLFGLKITDTYRGMEALGPDTLAWMKAQGTYTRSVLDAIKPLPALRARAAAFTGSFGFLQNYATFGRAFYEERAPGSDNFDLMVRDPDGRVRKLIDIAALRSAHGGTPFAINYILPSPDGSKIAAGVSQGGSEAAQLFVYDTATGARIAGPIDRAQYGATTWSEDGAKLYFIRLKVLGPSDPGTEKYRSPSLDGWDLKAEPVALYGAATGHGPKFGPDETPVLEIVPGAPMALLISQNGVQNEIKAWLTPADKAGSPDAPWTPFLDRADGVTGADARGDQIFLLSHKDAPTFQVLQVRAGEPLASAQVLAPARPDRVIEGVHAAADALYVVTRQGVYSHLLRIPTGGNAIEDVPLPEHGHIGDVFTDPRVAGLSMQLSSWVSPPTEYRFDPAKGAFTDLKLGVAGDINAADFKVSDLQAKARDGVDVPLSLIQPRGATGPQTTVVEAYGSYGISELPDFSPRRATFMKEGITYGICHVRGGGELGEAWRLGGKDANKPNTWRDLIACGEDLVARGVTSRDKLFIIGGSAGGITMGRAMEERPDLFAGVLDLVPAANTLRSEFTPNGPDNIPEFGTVTTKDGAQNLYEMDSVVHVKAGVAYPPIMIATGLNDPRVSPWEPAKFAATLEASGDPNPVLLRIDEQAGHGIGSTRSQGDALNADQIAFVFWRAGRPGWRPEVGR